MSLTIALYVAIQLHGNAATDPMDALQSLRVDHVAPLAVLIKRREDAGFVGISLYRLPPEKVGDPMRWRARRAETGSPSFNGVQWAEQETCGALVEALAAVERTPQPRIELRVPDPSSRKLPVMGPLHLTYELSPRASDAGNRPVWLSMRSLGSGEPQRLFENVETLLAECWSNDAASIAVTSTPAANSVGD